MCKIAKKGIHMEYKQFKKEFRREVQREVGAGAEIFFHKIKRNNQVRQEGMVVREKGDNISSILPLFQLYGTYQESGSMRQAVTAALKMLEEKSKILEGRLPKTWAEARGKLHAELVHYEWNKEALENIPYQRFLNFAVVYRMEVPMLEKCEAGMRVNHHLMEMWGITKEQLHKTAMENLENEAYQIQPISKVLGELMGTVLEMPEDDTGEYVLSNARCHYGAAGMLRKDILQEFSEKIGGNFYILPSSVHELILVPEIFPICTEYLREMVGEVNEGDVVREEWLSEDVYYYDCEKHEVKICDAKETVSD